MYALSAELQIYTSFQHSSPPADAVSISRNVLRTMRHSRLPQRNDNRYEPLRAHTITVHEVEAHAHEHCQNASENQEFLDKLTDKMIGRPYTEKPSLKNKEGR